MRLTRSSAGSSFRFPILLLRWMRVAWGAGWDAEEGGNGCKLTQELPTRPIEAARELMTSSLSFPEGTRIVRAPTRDAQRRIAPK